jgi:hypothetical protein
VSRVARILLLLLVIAAIVVLFVFACGDDGDEQAARTTTVTSTTEAQARERTRTTQTGDQGGAQVLDSPGSASLTPETEGGVAALGLGSASETGVFRPFSASSPWNTEVLRLPVDSRSARWIRGAQRRVGVQETDQGVTRRTRVIRAGVFVNTTKFTTPIVDEEGGVPTRVVCRQLPPYCGDGVRVETLTIPADVNPLPQYDGWFTVINRGRGVAYDLWRARRGGPEGNVISYQFMRQWDLNGPGFQEPNSVSARGSGLPLFAGIILPEEIRAGRIDHALAISLPGPAQRIYMQPASATDGNGALTSIPEGARVRLKSNVRLSFRPCPRTTAERRALQQQRAFLDETGASDRSIRCFPDRTNRRAARAIFEALRRYGAIVVDRSRVPSLYAKQNFNWNQLLRDSRGRLLDSDGKLLSRFIRRLPNQGTPLLRGNEIEQLKITDFEVVGTGAPLLRFPALGSTQAASRAQGTARTTTTTTTTGAPATTTTTTPAPATTTTTRTTAP